MMKFRAILPVLCVALAQAASAEEPFTHDIALEQKAVGTYYIHGSLGDGVETDLLVDTGSTYVALTRETFRKVKRQGGVSHLRDIRGSMASGRMLNVSIYRVPALAIGDGCVLRDVEVAVVPGANRDILGLSALRQLQPFAMQMEPPRLLFSSCSAGQST